MLRLHPSRPLILNLTLVGFLAAPFAATAAALADYAAGSAAPPAMPRQLTARPAVRTALREFDRFLDHHPVLEDRLRLAPRLTHDPGFLKKNPELREFLNENPRVPEGLKLYPHYYLNRALLRQANGPVPCREFAPFRELFLHQPALERALTRNPELVRNPAFVVTHPPLQECLLSHPALGRAFLPPATFHQSK